MFLDRRCTDEVITAFRHVLENKQVFRAKTPDLTGLDYVEQRGFINVSLRHSLARMIGYDYFFAEACAKHRLINAAYAGTLTV